MPGVGGDLQKDRRKGTYPRHQTESLSWVVANPGQRLLLVPQPLSLQKPDNTVSLVWMSAQGFNVSQCRFTCAQHTRMTWFWQQETLAGLFNKAFQAEAF